MSSAIGLLTPVKAAIGRWMVGFHQQFTPDTPALVEWAGRAPARALAWAPARMVDQVESMLSTWKRNDNGESSTSAYLPVVFMAVASDYTETPGDHGRPLTDWLPISFDDDTLKRSFRVRVMHADLRAQVVMVAPESMSAMSLVGQLCHWAIGEPRMLAPFEFAGFTTQWPVRVMQADRLAIPTPVGEQLSILAVDLNFRISLPLFKGPAGSEATDGHEPPGYPVVQEVESGHDMTLGPPSGVTGDEWAAFAARARWADGPPRVGLYPVQEGR